MVGEPVVARVLPAYVATATAAAASFAAADRVLSVPALELRALAIAAATFGDRWRGRNVLFHCDCLPAVQAFAKLTSRSGPLMAAIRSLLDVAARGGFDVRVVHVPRVANAPADLLSRGQVEAFLALADAAPPADALRRVSRLATHPRSLPTPIWA